MARSASSLKRSDDAGRGCLLVVIAFYYRAIQVANTFDAFTRICVVTDHVAKADKVRASAFTRVRHYGFERFEIRMDVTENCEPHDEHR